MSQQIYNAEKQAFAIEQAITNWNYIAKQLRKVEPDPKTGITSLTHEAATRGDKLAVENDRLRALNAELESGHKHMCDEWTKSEALTCELFHALQAVVDRYAPSAAPANDAIATMWANARAAIAKATQHG